MPIWQVGDVVAYRMGRLMRGDMARSVGIDVVTPPRHDQPTLLQKLGLVDVRSAHAVTLLMAHLPLNRRVRPQPRFEQGATGHGPETMPAHVLGGVVAHIAQHLVNRILRQGFPVPVVTGQHQFREPIQAAQPFKDLDDLRRQRHYLNVPTHLGPACGIADAFNRLAGIGDLPHCPLQIEFIPPCKAQFAGAHEHMQRQSHCESSQLATGVVVDSAQQIRESAGRCTVRGA